GPDGWGGWERGFEVERESPVEVHLGQVFQLAAQRDTAVVDEHIDGTERLLNVLDEALDRSAAGDIGLERRATAPESANRSDYGLRLGGPAAVIHRHVGIGLGQR